MQLLPQQLVVGVAVPAWTPGMPGGVTLTTDRLSRLFGDLTAVGPYKQFQLLSPAGVVISGDTPETGVNIQPPLAQVVVNARTLLTESQANFVESVYRVIFKVLGAAETVNVGVKTTWFAPAPPGVGAKAFTRSALVGLAANHLDELNAGDDPWVGAKFVVPLRDVPVTLAVEPLHMDDSMLYIDAQVQHQGAVTLDGINAAVEEAESFVTTDVRRFLERCADG